MASRKPKIILATDHAGFRLKEEIAGFLRNKGYFVDDFGTFSDKPVDYPGFIIPACEAVAASRGRAVGIVFGGSGLGECLAANKVKGIRAVAAYDHYTVKMSREHNNANVLSLGSRTVTGSPQVAKRLISLWLKTPFSSDSRHRRRLGQISKYENGKPTDGNN